MRTNEELNGCTLAGPERYSEEWLAQHDKHVVPFVAGTRLGSDHVRRLVAGSRACGARAILISTLAEGREKQPLTEAAVSQASVDTAVGDRYRGRPALVAASNLRGALLLTEHGYALIAGDAHFLGGAAGEGVDRLRTQFERTARRLSARVPTLQDVARRYPARYVAWGSLRDVPAGTGMARQVAVMRSFAHGEIAAPEFAKGWLAGRRKALRDGERAREWIASDMQEIFAALEEYSFGESPCEPGSLTGDELRARVQSVVLRWRI
ncbi:hypothetical protein OYE22_13445 [Streptomyces sp. 71268]|uniref:hypothetical protein n=1 Tax=Streptomyces sp. 71268 TaxID=3002640 RepID=UPI0023F703C8|nr:hypothetical protein [Streptomyces sp. 71268]WEV26092.1 hypothetical protein OYE22_13445 [Streptomyces sp. 71268]